MKIIDAKIHAGVSSYRSTSPSYPPALSCTIFAKEENVDFIFSQVFQIKLLQHRVILH
jgi:hypothetical protein